MRINGVMLLFVLVVLVMIMMPVDSIAQCPMCKLSAESNMKGGGTFGNGLNAGIIYMLATPYLLVGTIGFIWWRNRRKSDDADALTE